MSASGREQLAAMAAGHLCGCESRRVSVVGKDAT